MPKPKTYKIGPYIKAIREMRSVTQEALATQIGVSRVTMSHVENDAHEIKLQDFLRICDALSMRPSKFFLDYEERLNPEWHSRAKNVKTEETRSDND